MAVKWLDVATVQTWSIGASCSVIFDLLTACLMVGIIVHYLPCLKHAPKPAWFGLRACFPSASAFSRFAAMVRIVPVFRFVFVQIYSLSPPTYFERLGKAQASPPISDAVPAGIALFRLPYFSACPSHRYFSLCLMVSILGKEAQISRSILAESSGIY